MFSLPNITFRGVEIGSALQRSKKKNRVHLISCQSGHRRWWRWSFLAASSPLVTTAHPGSLTPFIYVSKTFLFFSLSHNNPVNIGNGNRSRHRASGRVGSCREWPTERPTFDRVGFEKKKIRNISTFARKSRRRKKFSFFDSFINFATWWVIHL